MFPRHATDVISLVFGIILTGLTVVWLLTVNDVIDYQQAWIGGPITLVAAGVGGLVAALQPRNRAGQPSYAEPHSARTEDPL
ncbi:MAG: hypothetical protein ABJA81_08130 [Nocardioidaceae bacterium]